MLTFRKIQWKIPVFFMEGMWADRKWPEILIMENKVMLLYNTRLSEMVGIINNYFQFKNTYKRNFMIMEGKC